MYSSLSKCLAAFAKLPLEELDGEVVIVSLVVGGGENPFGLDCDGGCFKVRGSDDYFAGMVMAILASLWSVVSASTLMMVVMPRGRTAKNFLSRQRRAREALRQRNEDDFFQAARCGDAWRQVERLQGNRRELFVVDGHGRSIKIDGGLDSLESADERGDLMTAW